MPRRRHTPSSFSRPPSVPVYFQWKDISSYSQGDASREPQSLEMLVGPHCRLIVTRHLHYPGKWITRSSFEIQHVLDAVTLDEAKAEAIKLLKEQVNALWSDVSVL